MTTDRYSPLARAFHWATALLIALQFACGLVMVYDGPEPNVWATLADRFQLYDSHKVLGLALLALALVRLAYRAARGGPAPLAEIPPLQRRAAGLAHAALYLLLVGVPLLGWLGISLYPALTVFERARLPALASPDRAMSETVLYWHAWAAFALVGLVVVHAGAALHHHFVRRDRTLLRMLGR
jgi:cytochrome b561